MRDLSNALISFKDSVGTWFSNLWNNNLKPAFENVGKSISDFNSAVGNWFSNLWNNNLKPAFANMGKSISDFNSSVGNWFTSLWTNIQDFFAGIPEFFTKFWFNIQSFFISIFVPEDDYFDNVMSDIKESFRDKIPYEDFQNLFESVQNVDSNSSGLNVNFKGYKVGNKNFSSGSNWVKFDFVLKHKDTWFAWCRGFTYIFFLIYNINQFLKFLGRLGVVEGNNMSINSNSQSGKGESNK